MAAGRVVAIVDDDEGVRLSTAFLLERANYSVRLFESGDSFLRASPFDYACIILDIRMPGTDGLSVLRETCGRDICPPVIVVTGHGDVPLAIEAMKLGALDFLEKPYDAETLLAVLAGVMEVRDSVDRESVRSLEAVRLVGALSERQREVLCHLVRGDPNKIIAWKLGLSIRTVESHRAQVMERLGTRSIAGAIRIALAAGLPDVQCEPSLPES